MPRTATLEPVRTVDVPMTLDAEKSSTLKHSVLFRAPEPEEGAARPAAASLYLRREAWQGMGEPNAITVSLTAGD